MSASPPIQFPVYGLDRSWPGPRWLEMFGDEIGDPPRWVSLGHLSPAGDAQIMVKTYARLATGSPRSYQLPTDAQAAELGKSPLEWLAFNAAFELTDLTLPERSRARPPGFLRTLVDQAERAGQDHARWATVRWTVDGVVVTAHQWRFAGGWAAYTGVVDDVYLYAIGLGADPEGLSLARLHDGAAYHFDLGQPLSPGTMSASRSAVGLDGRPEPRPPDWHPDQLRLM